MDDKKYSTIYIVRHGETDWNRLGRLQGNLPIPLNATGRRQAKEIAKTLRGADFSAVYSSDARRAVETAEIIAADHKLVANLSKYIRERGYGSLIGKTESEYSENARKLLQKYYAITNIEKYWKHRPMRNHESVLDVEKRTLLFLREVAVANIGRNVAVVTHGAAIRILLALLGWVPKEDFYKVVVSNTGYIVVKSDGTDIILDKISGVKKGRG